MKGCHHHTSYLVMWAHLIIRWYDSHLIPHKSSALTTWKKKISHSDRKMNFFWIDYKYFKDYVRDGTDCLNRTDQPLESWTLNKNLFYVSFMSNFMNEHVWGDLKDSNDSEIYWILLYAGIKFSLQTTWAWEIDFPHIWSINHVCMYYS